MSTICQLAVCTYLWFWYSRSKCVMFQWRCINVTHNGTRAVFHGHRLKVFVWKFPGRNNWWPTSFPYADAIKPSCATIRGECSSWRPFLVWSAKQYNDLNIALFVAYLNWAFKHSNPGGNVARNFIKCKHSETAQIRPWVEASDIPGRNVC